MKIYTINATTSDGRRFRTLSKKSMEDAKLEAERIVDEIEKFYAGPGEMRTERTMCSGDLFTIRVFIDASVYFFIEVISNNLN